MKIFFSTILFSVATLIAFSQTHFQISHLSGTKSINGINVTVRSFGQIAILENLDYCSGKTGPYYFGYNYHDFISDYGGFEFTFDPPALLLSVNITGLSADDENMEEVRFFVNGIHYPIQEKGVKIECEEMAVLTPKGNIRPCRDCAISGWEGTSIIGPISSFKVIDTVFSGNPAGALIALYIVKPDEKLTNIYRVKLSDLHAGIDVPITTASINLKEATLTVTDINGSKVLLDHSIISNEHQGNINSLEFIKGTYTLTIRNGTEEEIQQIIIE